MNTSLGDTFFGWTIEDLELYVNFIKENDTLLWNEYRKEEQKHGDTTGISQYVSNELNRMARKLLFEEKKPELNPLMLFALLRKDFDQYI